MSLSKFDFQRIIRVRKKKLGLSLWPSGNSEDSLVEEPGQGGPECTDQDGTLDEISAFVH